MPNLTLRQRERAAAALTAFRSMKAAAADTLAYLEAKPTLDATETTLRAAHRTAAAQMEEGDVQAAALWYKMWDARANEDATMSEILDEIYPLLEPVNPTLQQAAAYRKLQVLRDTMTLRLYHNANPEPDDPEIGVEDSPRVVPNGSG